MKRILCYGDSNTWGYRPGEGSRFSRNSRWPSIMPKYLKDDYIVIEEGLNGRTALNLYPGYDAANGIDFIVKTAESHVPVNIAIIFLGLNDIFAAPEEPLWKIAGAIEEIADIIIKANTSRGFGSPEIIITGLPQLALSPDEAQFYELIINKIKGFPEILHQLSEKNGYHYIDIYSKIKTSYLDGTHLDESGHRKLAEITAEYINRLK